MAREKLVEVVQPTTFDVTIARAALLALLATTLRSLGDPKGVPMFTSVCLAAQGAELRARTTDCILAIDTGAAAVVLAPGSICVEHRLFHKIVGGMPDGDVRLRVQGMTLAITAPRRKATLFCLDGRDFPSLPPCNSPIALRVDAVPFRALLARVAPMSSDDDGRPHLAGVYLRGEEGHLLMVTSNGHALVKDHLPHDGIPSFHTIVPNVVVREVLHCLAEVEGEVLLEISKPSGRIRLTVGECKLLGPLVDAAFPSWEQVVPNGSDNQIHIDVAALSQALKSFAILAVSGEIRNGCEIAFDKAAGELLVTAQSDMGSQEARVPAEVTGEPARFRMNRNLLTAALDACASKRAQIEVRGELDPFLFTSDERPDFAAVVMPQRI